MIHPHHFLIMSLAVWRVANMVVEEAGPGNIFGRFRARFIRPEDIDRDGSLSQMLSCVYCMCVWLALLVFLGYALYPFVTLYVCIPLGISAVGALLQQFTYDRSLSVHERRQDAPPEALND